MPRTTGAANSHDDIKVHERLPHRFRETDGVMADLTLFMLPVPPKLFTATDLKAQAPGQLIHLSRRCAVLDRGDR